MKLKRDELVDRMAKIIRNSINLPTTNDIANSVLTDLQNLGVVQSSIKTKTVIRKDIECMPYEDEIVVEEFGL